VSSIFESPVVVAVKSPVEMFVVAADVPSIV
jgi:hypothetical protein